MGEGLSRRMTVLQVVPALHGGGVERSTLEVGAELACQGHRSLVISAGGRLVRELQANGSEHISWPIGRKSPLTLRLVPRLRRLLVRERVDILHARSRLPAWVAWLAWRGMAPDTRPRFITTVHGLNSVNAYSAVMVKGERIIAVSDTVRGYILEHYPAVDPERITVIPRGVDPSVFSPGFRPDAAWLAGWHRQHPHLQNSFLLTLPGRVGTRKGVHDFIEIIAMLKSRGLPAHGLVVGGFPQGRQGPGRALCSRISDLGLDAAITFTGFRSDVREILAVSDVVLSLSGMPEAFGRTVNEALALGVPVAGYAHGGVGEQLERHFPAGLVSPDDRHAMTDRLAAWYDSPPPMQGIRPYALDDMLTLTLDLYRSAGTTPVSTG
jgi:glycosyltransferase involved in cell wall biosynthesis